MKETLLFLLMGGKELPKEHLFQAFVKLSDLSGISYTDDFENPSLNSTTLFAEKSFNMFMNEQYDEWLEFFKKELLKLEAYELISELDL